MQVPKYLQCLRKYLQGTEHISCKFKNIYRHQEIFTKRLNIFHACSKIFTVPQKIFTKGRKIFKKGLNIFYASSKNIYSPSENIYRPQGYLRGQPKKILQGLEIFTMALT